ncbi:TRAP transporter large permease subunit, partial [Rhizobium leguminosarum]|uniref:TRAP transporter large permease subunit n=1 Tax=Rhizobium leguminosarum TaxID=384 RepID=UPI003F96B6B6
AMKRAPIETFAIMAGILPGIVMTLLMMITVAAYAYKKRWGSDAPFDVRQLLSAGMEIVVVLAVQLAIYLMMRAGVSMNSAAGISLALLL